MMIEMDNFSISIEKLKLYMKEEDLFFDNINNLLDNISFCYKNNNQVKLDKLSSEIMSNFKVIDIIHENNLFVLNKAINRYKDTASEVKSIFENMDKM